MSLINEEQKARLESYRIKRISTIPNAQDLLDSFQVEEEGTGILNAIKQSGVKNDVQGKEATYFIFNPEDEVVFLFTLKPGQLFGKIFNLVEIRKLSYDYSKKANQILYSLANNDLEPRLMGLESNKTPTREELLKASKLLMEKAEYLNGTGNNYQNDINLEKKGISKEEPVPPEGKPKNDDHNLRSNDVKSERSEIIRVNETITGVELVNFLRNQKCKGDSLVTGNHSKKMRMGELFFWHFVVPIIASVRELIGCEYVYLFAAQGKKNKQRLYDYYQGLGFDIDPSVSVLKPIYDFSCLFLCQTVDSMLGLKEMAERMHNPDDLEDNDLIQNELENDYIQKNRKTNGEEM